MESLSCPTLRAQDAGDLVDSDIERVPSSRRERFACNNIASDMFQTCERRSLPKRKADFRIDGGFLANCERIV